MKKRLSILAALCLIGIAAAVLVATQRHREIKHIVLISIDTCRADHLSCYGYPQNTTPNIDAFAREATLFQNVISPVPITLPAHSSMLTGTIPPFHGVHNNVDYQLAPSNETLPETLKRNGFNTAGIVSAFVMNKDRGLAQGFDTYYDVFNETTLKRFGNERRGDETTKVAIDWIDHNEDRPFFLFLHYYDPHSDYTPPEPYASRFPGNPYAGEIAFTDHCIGQVIQKLKELEIYDSTLIIITGDHGEMLGEHGEEEHSYFIYESAIKVPLIIRLPGQNKRETISESVGLVDIVPTLCSLLDIDIPTRIQGRNIASLLQGNVPDNYERFIYSESIEPTRIGASSLMAISAGQWKFIQAARPELYDLANDPGEENNMIEKEPHRVRILEDKLRETLEQSVSKEANSRVQLDPESIKRLQSLGYVSGINEGEITFDSDQEDPKDLIPVFRQFQKALALIEQDEHKVAENMLTELIPLRPGFHEIYIKLGDIAIHEQDFDQAIVRYRQAVELKPTILMSLNNLAWIQATRPSLPSSDVEEALRLGRQLCALSHFSDPNSLDTLAVAYAAAGDFPKAIETAKKALALANSAKDTQLATKVAKRLRLFEKSEPYIEK